MIIGIDDSGNFSSDPKSFYAAVFIRPKKYRKISKMFLEWESRLPEAMKDNGEVKGRLLSEEQICDFANNILRDNGYGSIKLQVFSIDISPENSDALIGQRTYNITQMRQQATEIYRNQGDEYKQIAAFYEQMSDWLKSKSLKTLYKIELLSVAIVKCINLSIITSALREFDKELASLEMNIDEGITGRKSVEYYWKDWMRTTFWNITSSVEPIIHITSWRENHPFVKRFYKYPNSHEKLSIFTHEIRNIFNFHNSQDKPEIRMADIVANAYFRKYVRNEKLDEAMQLLANQRIEFGRPYVQIALTNRINPNPLNPYTDRIYGVTAAELEDKYDLPNLG